MFALWLLRKTIILAHLIVLIIQSRPTTVRLQFQFINLTLFSQPRRPEPATLSQAPHASHGRPRTLHVGPNVQSFKSGWVRALPQRRRSLLYDGQSQVCSILVMVCCLECSSATKCTTSFKLNCLATLLTVLRYFTLGNITCDLLHEKLAQCNSALTAPCGHSILWLFFSRLLSIESLDVLCSTKL